MKIITSDEKTIEIDPELLPYCKRVPSVIDKLTVFSDSHEIEQALTTLRVSLRKKIPIAQMRITDTILTGAKALGIREIEDVAIRFGVFPEKVEDMLTIDDLKEMTREEVDAHNKAVPTEPWIIISKFVCDVTKYGPRHPGGRIIVKEIPRNGGESSVCFKRHHRTRNSVKQMASTVIGVVPDDVIVKTQLMPPGMGREPVGPSRNFELSILREMSKIREKERKKAERKEGEK
ncbi:hypothetical protein ADUPG1_004681 [Aduncisulcus paluster]|uniref:Cytochrome b5 heme-binding domain-containing protein n=1 Tax=Aduncisulcus paluster TaxID=2918883 RepID=A0ABQ5K708_9EUKA|nr:hypothetical protein ADUPG1_004681 [Aduncisulcus paluster]|eukprot:gnl/Carplike_NY0171/1737_a2345_1129.p1 GENE.gnl/Carplike_NY0171/1737_a2345_1129~~gnl/Carplike_NY0171/1737_a2345_1129.p1  ORF type:complete len:233 (-),score=57.48 gnl/Carplike_NY0171/1737_a2345_1129:132-830(-)